MTILFSRRRSARSRSQSGQPTHGLRRRVVRLLRWALGDSVLYAKVKRLSKVVEIRLLLRRLPVSSTLAHRQVAPRLASAVSRGDEQAALAIAKNARQKPDRKAEKIVSNRYEFVWICNPKVASRSIIQALLAAEPEAILVEEKTIEELLSAWPKARQFFSFAFLRDPCERARSFYYDKLDLGPLASKWNVDRRFYGLCKGMTFADYCRWLDTPFGSDAFAEKHWLSQHEQIQVEGHLPDYVGSHENLEENWRWVSARVGLPHIELPHLNRRRVGADVEVDGDSKAILRRRYERDFDLLRKVGTRGINRDEVR